MKTDNKEQSFLNDAFISYSRKDREFAARLEQALEKYKTPKGMDLPRRNLVIFRDEEDFTGTEYHTALKQHLKSSRKLILICSPYARQSPFVNDEIHRFAEERGKENIIPVLVSGIPNNEAKPDQEEEKAFPEVLCKIQEMPLATSYIGFDMKRDKVNKGSFQGGWYKILADLYSVSRSEIEERDRKRRRKLFVMTVIAISIIISVISAIGIYAWYQKIGTEKKMRVVQAQYLAAQSDKFMESYPERSLLLAVAGIYQTLQTDGIVVPATENSLRELLSVTGGSPMRFPNDLIKLVTFNIGDNCWLVSQKDNDTVQIKNLDDPQKDTTNLKGQKGKITSIAISPDGKKLATGSEDGIIRIWSLDNPQSPIHTLEGHEVTVTCMIFSADGKFLASGGGDGKIAKNSVSFWRLYNDKGQLDVAPYGPDGKRLTSYVNDRTVRIWNLDDPHPTSVILGKLNESIDSIAFNFSSNGRKVASGSLNGVHIWNLDKPEAKPDVLFLDFYSRGVLSVVISPDGKWLATGSRDGKVHVWRLDTPQDRPWIELVHGGEVVYSVVFSPNGKWLASGGDNRIIRLWNLEFLKAEPLTLRGHEDHVLSIAFSHDSKRLVSRDSDGTVRIWSTENPHADAVILKGHKKNITSIAFCPNKKRLVSGGHDGLVHIWRLDNPLTMPVVPKGQEGCVTSVAISPEGKWLASGSTDGKIRICKLDDPQPTFIVKGNHQGVLTLAFNPANGKQLASGGEDGTVRVWNLEDLGASYVIPRGQKGVVRSVAISHDGKWLASGGGNGKVRIWALDNLQADPLILTGGHIDKNIVTSIAFSPNDTKLAGGFIEGTIYIWSLNYPHEPLFILKSNAGTYSVTFNPVNGKQLISGGPMEKGNRQVSIWNLDDLKAGSVDLPVRSIVSSIAVSPDGKWLASGNWDDVVRLWTLNINELCRRACDVAGRNLTCEEWQQFFQDEPYFPICPDFPYPKDCEQNAKM